MADEQLKLLDEEQGGPARPKPPRRYPWAWLLSRVFGADIIECPQCGGRLRVVEVVSEPADIARVLHDRVARAPPPDLLGQLVLDFADVNRVAMFDGFLEQNGLAGLACALREGLAEWPRELPVTGP